LLLDSQAVSTWLGEVLATIRWLATSESPLLALRHPHYLCATNLPRVHHRFSQQEAARFVHIAVGTAMVQRRNEHAPSAVRLVDLEAVAGLAQIMQGHDADA